MTATLDIVSAKIDTLTDMVAALQKQGPAPGSAPPTDPAAAAVAAFVAEFTPLDPAAFQAKYDVAFQSKLPSLGATPLPDAVKAYAQNGYNADGNYVGGPTCAAGQDASPEAVAAQAVNENANHLATYLTGNGETDAYVAVVLAKMGMVLSYNKWREFCTGPTPARWKKIDFNTFVAGIRGGPPSGG